MDRCQIGSPVIIPSNSSERLRVSLAAVLRSHRADVYVVDDGLREHPAGAHYVPGIRPFVFARNVNIGVERALAEHHDAPGIVLLNDDAVIETPGGLAILEQAGANLGAAAVFPACDHAHPSQARHDPRAIPRRISWALPFVCVWLSADAWRMVGGLDPNFTEYGWEDNDWLLRAKLAGWSWYLDGRVMVRHKVLPSAYRGAPGSYRPITAGARIFERKWGRLWY